MPTDGASANRPGKRHRLWRLACFRCSQTSHEWRSTVVLQTTTETPEVKWNCREDAPCARKTGKTANLVEAFDTEDYSSMQIGGRFSGSADASSRMERRPEMVISLPGCSVVARWKIQPTDSARRASLTGACPPQRVTESWSRQSQGWFAVDTRLCTVIKKSADRRSAFA